MYRPAARLGVGVDDSGSTIGSEVQLGAAIAYADTHLRLAVGPELVASTVVLGSANVKPFSRDYTSVETLLGLHYNIAHLLQLGIGGGLGLLRTPGTPDGRVLLRLAYAPWPKEPAKVVEQDRDRDGILDADDRCPDVHKGERPDPERVGCPIADRDADGFLDPDDRCPDGSRPTSRSAAARLSPGRSRRGWCARCCRPVPRHRQGPSARCPAFGLPDGRPRS